jgi:hypothetical protein
MSFGETHEKDVDGSVISSDHSPLHKRKLFTLWDVDIYEDDIYGVFEAEEWFNI